MLRKWKKIFCVEAEVCKNLNENEAFDEEKNHFSQYHRSLKLKSIFFIFLFFLNEGRFSFPHYKNPRQGAVHIFESVQVLRET